MAQKRLCLSSLETSVLKLSIKKREAALKNEAGGDEKHVFFLLGLKSCETTFMYHKVNTEGKVSYLSMSMRT